MNADFTPWVKAMELARSVAADGHRTVIVYHRLCDGQWFVCTEGDRPPAGQAVKYTVHADSLSLEPGVKPETRPVDGAGTARAARKETGRPLKRLAMAKR